MPTSDEPPPRFQDSYTVLADGRRLSTEELVPLIYDDLRDIAGGYFHREVPGRTLQPTALVHEAYLRLADQDVEGWQNRAQFLGVAALAMRRVLVDAARARSSEKRGGGLRRVTLAEGSDDQQALEADLLDLDAALDRLAKVKESYAKIIELRFFGGQSIREAAHVLGVSTTTVEKQWAEARGWLGYFLDAK